MNRDHFVDVEKAKYYTFATLLDPRWTTTAFQDESKREAAVDQLRAALRQVVDTTITSEVETSPLLLTTATSTTRSPFDECFNIETEVVINRREADEGQAEFDAYFREPVLQKDKSPFIWWAAREEKYPNLSRLARDYLCSPQSSIASEREFKVAKRVVTGRSQLKPENVEILLFLKYNLRMVDYKY